MIDDPLSAGTDQTMRTERSEGVTDVITGDAGASTIGARRDDRNDGVDAVVAESGTPSVTGCTTSAVDALMNAT